MYKKNIIIFIILSFFISVYFYIYKNNKIIQAISYENFNIIQSEINSYSMYSNEYLSLNEMENISDEILKKLNIYGDVVKEKNANKNGNIFSCNRISKNANTIIRFKSTKDSKNRYQTYLSIDIKIYNDYNSIIYYKSLLNDIYEGYHIKPIFNTLTISNSKGKMDIYGYKQVVKKLCDIYDIIVREDYEDDYVYSITGYSKDFDGYIISNNKKINVNIAMNYNECEDRTYLYFATPIITVEY